MRRIFILFFSILLCGWSVLSTANDIDIVRVEGKRIDNFYFVDARLTMRLTKDAREAVESGVPLVFAFEFEIRQRRRWLWDLTLLALRRTYKLERHALANRYVITDIVGNKRLVAPSLDDALAELGELHDVPVGKAAELLNNGENSGRMRVRLDIESLPAPLRPVAYISPSWHIGSDWQNWDLVP
ncbi:MAG: DUF4390 domain-containing protein [Gammaproteobacteria bacterium]|nr:DUF4390 domain-containing protein [Gammaproteobacteria bacterium]